MQLIDRWDHIWFTRLIDFYIDFHKKINYEVPLIIKALTELIEFLGEAAQLTKQPSNME